MKKVNPIDHQNYLDLAIQEYGDPSLAFELAIANGNALTDMPAIGNVQHLPTANIIQKEIQNFYRKKGLKPATAVLPSQLELQEETGIGFWAIQLNFKVNEWHEA